MTRPVQTSLIDGMERPVGRIPLSVIEGTNADLIAAVAPIYLTGSVLDVTYGRGKWWDRFTPHPFTFHDLHTVDGVDFTRLSHPDRSFDAVCFDPPYIPAGGSRTSGATSDEANFRLARTLEVRAHYREVRITENAARTLCRAREHRPDGIRGCAECRADVILIGGI